jgi:carboxyl-terminal processing protease
MLCIKVTDHIVARFITVYKEIPMKKYEFLLALCLFLFPFNSVFSDDRILTYQQRFDEVCQIVEAHFYDPTVVEEQFKLITPDFRARVADLTSDEAFRELVNEMLQTLKVSHTGYYTPDDYEYYQLAAIFHFLPGIQELFDHQDVSYPSIGILTQTIEDRVFVASVLSGSRAETAGFLAGDEILTVNGSAYAPILPLREHIDQDVTFTIRRAADGEPVALTVAPRLINPKHEFLEAQQASARIYERENFQIGYVHIWSYAGEEYHKALIEAIAWAPLANADALILDLRYGWGGANPDYLNIFNTQVPVIEHIERDGTVRRFDPQWRKPVLMLVNHTVRSGKEILAYGLKHYQLGTVLGETTAGAVLGGRVFVLSNGDLLLLAAGGARVNGEILEGVGVEPHITVPRDIRYCEGTDIQLEQAIQVLHKTLEDAQ